MRDYPIYANFILQKFRFYVVITIVFNQIIITKYASQTKITKKVFVPRLFWCGPNISFDLQV